MFVPNTKLKGYSGGPYFEVSDSDALIAQGDFGRWFPGMKGSADHTEWADLDHLATYQVVSAERKLDGQTLDGRCQSVASILGVPQTDLAKLVTWWLGKLPANDVNRPIDREDVEQAIYAKLLRNTKNRGSWELVKLDIRCAYIDWYRRFRADGSIGEHQAISLDRQAYLDETQGTTLAESIPESADYLGEILDKLHVDTVLTALPKPIASILGKRLTETPLTAEERQRWHRFMAKGANVQGILGLLNGTISRKPRWDYKGEVGRPRKADRPHNGPVVVVKPASRKLSQLAAA